MIETQEIYDKLDRGDNITKKISYIHKSKTHNKSTKMSIGRIWFNSLLPDDFKLVDEAITKDKLDDIIIQIFKKYGPDKATSILSKIQSEAFKMATIHPNTFNIDGMIIPEDLKNKKDIFESKVKDMSIDEFNKESDKLVKEFIKHIKKSNLSIQNVLEGGIKGNAVNDWKTLLIAKGYVVDIENEIYGPIVKGTSEGYTGEEYYKAAGEARRGFYFKSTAVQSPGYLARKVITANTNTMLDKTDCRSKKYLELFITAKKSKLVIGRFYLKGSKLTEITKENVDKIINKKIKIRSPLYCRSKNGICKICYGKLAEKLNSKSIGMIAGGAINTLVVNAMMKFRHKTSQVEVINVDFIKLLKQSKINMKDINLLFNVKNIQIPFNYAVKDCYSQDIKILTQLNRTICEKDNNNLLFNVKETKIICKQDCTVYIDKNEYNEKSLINSEQHYILPGIINVTIGEGETTELITLPFSFKVNLIKPKDFTLSGKLITMKYTVGETLIEKENYIKDQDPSVVERLFEGNIKYITDPEVLLENISNELPTADLTHLELIISNMFRDKDDNTKLCRLNSYKNAEILGQKKLPFINSWLSSLTFENVNKAIEGGLVNGQDAIMDPLERITLEERQKE